MHIPADAMEYQLKKLAQYLRGWMNYFGTSEYYRPIPEIDHWLRRRVRMCYWKQLAGVAPKSVISSNSVLPFGHGISRCPWYCEEPRRGYHG